MNKYISKREHKDLSRTASALLLPLMILANKNNEIDKKVFIKKVTWISDYRTWGKYWRELEEKNILIQLDKRLWMISPHECYSDGACHSTLINKWNEVNNAAS